MSFKKWLKNIFTGIFLLFTLISVIATSNTDGTPYSGDYHVISDCVTPVRDQVVSVAVSQITTGGVSFTDFGFPSATLAPELSGIVGAATRECRISYGNPDRLAIDSKHPTIYSCFDNGAFKCTIYMRPMN